VLTSGTERLQAEGGVLSNAPQRRNRNRNRDNICELGIRMPGGAMEQECLDETKLERWIAVVLIVLLTKLAQESCVCSHAGTLTCFAITLRVLNTPENTNLGLRLAATVHCRRSLRETAYPASGTSNLVALLATSSLRHSRRTLGACAILQRPVHNPWYEIACGGWGDAGTVLQLCTPWIARIPGASLFSIIFYKASYSSNNYVS
jgi:hypothetical protein